MTWALLADDDEIFRTAMAALLKGRCGFVEVVETDTFDEAVAVLGSTDRRPVCSLALFDLEMPGMSGAACLSAIRECFPEVKVAAITASTRRRDVLLALEAGVHGFVPKGLGIKELARAIDLIRADVVFVPTWITAVAPPSQRSALIPEAAIDPRAAFAPTSMRSPATGPRLTPRQANVLDLVVAGRTNKEIARALGLGEGTIKIHVSSLLRAFSVATRSGVAAAAARNAIIATSSAQAMRADHRRDAGSRPSTEVA